MATPSLPSDSSSLLVPLHLEAWVVDQWTKNAVDLARYTANYENLKNFTSPMPEPFNLPHQDPDDGIHLHWALPDALTHGREKPSGQGFEFPTVPNRWLVARFRNDKGTWKGKLWVVKSDNLDAIDLGNTAGEFTNKSESIPIARPGLAEPIGAAAKIHLDDVVFLRELPEALREHLHTH